VLRSLNKWLSCVDPLDRADAIFVLAGRENRKLYGLELFRQGLAPKILFSVGRFEIRRFSKMELPVPLDLLRIAADVPASKRHYFTLFDDGKVQVDYVQPGRFGTLTEIHALARWLDANPQINSLLIVSAGTHLRRLRLCCRALLRPSLKINFVAVPHSFSNPNENQPGSGAALGASLRELSKIALYWVLLTFRRTRNYRANAK